MRFQGGPTAFSYFTPSSAILVIFSLNKLKRKHIIRQLRAKRDRAPRLEQALSQFCNSTRQALVTPLGFCLIVMKQILRSMRTTEYIEGESKVSFPWPKGPTRSIFRGGGGKFALKKFLGWKSCFKALKAKKKLNFSVVAFTYLAVFNANR